MQSHGMKEREKWTKMVADRVNARGCIGTCPGAMTGEGYRTPSTSTTAGGRLSVRHIPGGRQPPGPGLTRARYGTEDRLSGG